MEELKIATYNIRTDTEIDGPFQWSARAASLNQVIEHYQWDIIGIQEARKHQLNDLLGSGVYDYVGEKRSADPMDEYNPILYRKSHFELLLTETSWLSPSRKTNTLATEWGAAFPRTYTKAKFKSKTSGKVFWFVNTHFDHVSEAARTHSAKQIVKDLEDIVSDEPLVITGDFNGEMDENWYQVLSTYAENARELVCHHVGPDGTFRNGDFFQPLDWGKLVQIDYIFVKNQVEVRQTVTVTDQFKGLYPSDHFAVSAIVRI